MQELVGRLTALDPEASESLKVIAYFDALVDGHANGEVLLRGAAVLSGCAAGFSAPGSFGRVGADGVRASAASSSDSDTAWPNHPISGGGMAWIERSDAAHANDAMILERLAIALGILFERSAPVALIRKSVEALLDGTVPTDERVAAAARLRLDSAALYRVIAQPAGSGAPVTGHAAVLVTRAGMVRASIVAADALPVDAVAAPRTGVGPAVAPSSLDRSWVSALLALRLTSPAEPVLRADDLGTVILLAEAADGAAAESPDLAAVRRVVAESVRTLGVLEAVVAAESLRSAATEVGIHHSTMQVKAAELSSALGFDIRTAAGRTRLSLALALYRLATNRFE